uniref:Defective in cullin neddylation protein n=1 Tax=Albugo laibachii Nc14 TaxID=890382 RepID=F0W5V0_9STRA|nr:conserved hypothetical protein [Albugo laibachii Nc14]|eukprot:CCA16491.1 conserved hypothetical protein [Albugo laibachii Nc14]
MTQKSLIDAFIEATNCRHTTASSYLERFKWNLGVAVDEFFNNYKGDSNRISHRASVSMDAINNWFDKYADPEEDDAITEDGILQFCEDIGIDPQAVDILVIAWKMESNYMCRFSRKEWCKGMQELECDTKEKLKSTILELRTYISTNQEFKQFYSFCFDFSKEPGQKSLGLAIAIPMWEVLLMDRFPQAASDWIQFLQESNPCKGVTRDTWDLLLDFFIKVNNSYETYDENEAWPVLIDEFVAYIRSREV